MEERQPSFLNFDDSYSTCTNEKRVWNLDRKIEDGVVPMDVDLDFDYEEQAQSNVTDKLASNHQQTRKLVVQNLKKTDTIEKCQTKTIFTLRNFLFLLIAIVGYYIYANYPLLMLTNTIESENLEKELHEEILDQNKAISLVSESLKNINEWKCKIKILPFVGGTGVGKTYMANILKKYFVHLTHELNGAHLLNLEEKEKVLTNLKSCCCNLLVIDDLKVSDTRNIINFIKSLPDTYSILILPIFNIQTTTENLEDEIHYDYVEVIKNLFGNSILYNEIVSFNTISEISLKKWLKNEMNKRNVPSSRQNELSEVILRQHDVKHGFKGLHSKLILAFNE